MENYSSALDDAFHALSDPTRRMVVSRLMRGPAPVKELAKPFEMGLPSFLKHLKILEESGLITSRKEGRVRTCEVRADRLAAVEKWFDEQRTVWASRYTKLDDLLVSLERDDFRRDHQDSSRSDDRREDPEGTGAGPRTINGEKDEI